MKLTSAAVGEGGGGRVEGGGGRVESREMRAEFLLLFHDTKSQGIKKFVENGLIELDQILRLPYDAFGRLVDFDCYLTQLNGSRPL